MTILWKNEKILSAYFPFQTVIFEAFSERVAIIWDNVVNGIRSLSPSNSHIINQKQDVFTKHQCPHNGHFFDFDKKVL